MLHLFVMDMDITAIHRRPDTKRGQLLLTLLKMLFVTHPHLARASVKPKKYNENEKYPPQHS